jgi:hypothetical protein
LLRRPVESALAALVGVEDDPGDGVGATTDRDRHLQGSGGQVGVVVLAQAVSRARIP